MVTPHLHRLREGTPPGRRGHYPANPTCCFVAVRVGRRHSTTWDGIQRLSDHQDPPGRHNARKAAARRLQQSHPWLRYTEAYALSTPKADSWRGFAESGAAIAVTMCAHLVTEAASLLVSAADECGEPRDRLRRVEGCQFATWLALCLTEVVVFADTLQATAPVVPDLPFQQSSSPPFPGPLLTHAGLGGVTTVLTEASWTASSLVALETPTEARDAARHVEALRAWVSTPPARDAR